jgi:N-acetylmuramoyl-L-alanine amidase
MPNARPDPGGQRTREGGDGAVRSRRLHLRLVSLALAALLTPGLALAAGEPITVLTATARRETNPVVRDGVELLPLEPLVAGTGVQFRPEPRKSAVILSLGGRQVTVYHGRNLASVGGELRLLTSAAVQDGNQWLVPVDSVSRILGPLLGQRVEWRPAVRTLLVGDVTLPRLVLRTSTSGDGAQVVLEGSRQVPFRVTQEPGRVLVAIPEGAVDVAFSEERLTGGIVDRVRFLGGRDNVVEITTGPRFLKLDAGEQGTRLVLQFQASPVPVTSADASPVPGASPSPGASPEPAPGGRARTVVIDPGHGGDDHGASGPNGTLEKEVALGVARRVRNALQNAGLQVFLTRERDDAIGLDERTAFANNYKADVFVSIHANASRAQSARGSEVYFLSAEATDDESRRLALLESGPGGGSPVAPSSDLAMILWDMAQAAHLSESSVLASRVQEELASVTGSQGRGVKQAPFRVLVGAAMPAVLVELAFISNSDEEKLLASEAYQSRVAGALVKGIARFLGGSGGVSASAAP